MRLQNRLNHAFNTDRKLLSIYLTAGFPRIDSTRVLINALAQNRVDIIEVGFPFSDPLADGPTIQRSSEIALQNGMSLERLFNDLEGIRAEVQVPLVLMGCFNPLYQYGAERFCDRCREIGIDGVIVPDLPRDEYLLSYRNQFEQHGLHFISLITPQTSDERIIEIDRSSSGFIYAVSSFAVTGGTLVFDQRFQRYIERIRALNLTNPVLTGFGVSNHASFVEASRHTAGAVVGSAFIKAVESAHDLDAAVSSFVSSLRG